MTRTGWFVRIAFSAALLILIWSAAAARAAAPNRETLVRLEPPTLEMKAGETAQLRVLIESAEGVYGYQFALAFDPAAAEVVDADPRKDGIQVGQGDFLSGESFVAINRADNGSGRVEYVATLLGQVDGRSGRGILAAVTMKAKVGGKVPLQLRDVKLAANDSRPIPIRVEGGEAAPPVPTLGPLEKAAALQPTAGAPATIAAAAAIPSAAPGATAPPPPATSAPPPQSVSAPPSQAQPAVSTARPIEPAAEAATGTPVLGLVGVLAVTVALGALLGSYLLRRGNGGGG